ncbi:tetratricopeptide repeat protein 8 isoform X2 [Chelonus insularis]|uniref:tetratricopeptide repeat protein 8 isoform X2 n=1 Tax=Chelonus insularis TaxID=460826 RepID=UPI001589B941|nr:tetratricopeptide repeat protein 8 isoform X2 [Chelonus insularis]
MELYTALCWFRIREFDKCTELCTNLLKKNPKDEAAWLLKMRALTSQVYVDDLETEEESIAETFFDNYTIAEIPRPGTSLRNPATSYEGQGIRPKTQSGRPVTGVVRPMTQGGAAKSMEQALRTARTATARPITTASGRVARLGTASMMSDPNGSFIELSRLNIQKYAKRQEIAKPLFEYIFYHEHDIRMGLDFAILGVQATEFKDWWWKFQMGKCYYMLGLIRDAEEQYKIVLKEHKSIDVVLRLVRVYVRLDQPIAALDLCKRGLDYFPNEVMIMTEMARIFEGLNNTTMSLKFYKQVVQEDGANIEAIASIAMHHFYNDQPEIAMALYRRLFQMGLYNAEILTNLGLCCFYAQQYDHTISCFLRALQEINEKNAPDVWYNISHIAIGRGDLIMAEECLRIAITLDNRHAISYNNLGILELKKGNLTAAKTYFVSAASIAEYMHEPHYNVALLSYKQGDLQMSYKSVQKALKAYPGHYESKELYKRLEPYFSSV